MATYTHHLEAYTIYGLHAPSAESLAVLHQTDRGLVELASGPGPWLHFTTDEEGPYTIAISSADETHHQISLYRPGEALETALDLPMAEPVPGTIGPAGHTWYRLSDLRPGRSLELIAHGATGIAFYTQDGACLAAGGGEACTFLPDEVRPYYARVSGEAGASITLRGADGSTPDRAYANVPPSGSSEPYVAPERTSVLFRLSLKPDTYYGINVPQTKAITLYADSVEVSTTTAEWAALTTASTDTEYTVRVVTGQLPQPYQIAVHGPGESRVTAYRYKAHGPLTRPSTPRGYVWFKLDDLTNGRTCILTFQGATAVTVYVKGDEFAQAQGDGSCPLLCQFRPEFREVYYALVTAPAGAAVTLSSVYDPPLLSKPIPPHTYPNDPYLSEPADPPPHPDAWETREAESVPADPIQAAERAALRRISQVYHEEGVTAWGEDLFHRMKVECLGPLLNSTPYAVGLVGVVGDTLQQLTGLWLFDSDEYLRIDGEAPGFHRGQNAADFIMQRALGEILKRVESGDVPVYVSDAVWDTAPLQGFLDAREIEVDEEAAWGEGYDLFKAGLTRVLGSILSGATVAVRTASGDASKGTTVSWVNLIQGTALYGLGLQTMVQVDVLEE